MTKRTERIADLIRGELSRLLLREIKDPRLGLITLTDVQVTPDLKIAKIYFGTMSVAPEEEGLVVEKDGGEHSVKEVLDGLNSAKGFLKRRIAQALDLRYVPDLQFYYDTTLDKAYRIESILKGIQE